MKEHIESHRDLRVWQRAMDLVMSCYAATARFPKAEQYGLTSQIRRAAVSVPANIAEGKGRRHLNDYLHHISFANGSILELDTLVEIARRLEYLSIAEADEIQAVIQEVGRMLNALAGALRRSGGKP